MIKQIWDLDNKPDYKKSEREKWITTKGYDKGINPSFKVGDVIEFFTGYNDDIRAKAKIKGIDGDDLYVFTDSYWFPIQDDVIRKIEITENKNK